MLKKMGRKSGPDKAKDWDYLKTLWSRMRCGSGSELKMALQVFLFVYLEGWGRGDMKRLKGAAAGCSWAGRRKLGET